MKTVLVTGACKNTGVAIVDKFAKEGWNVVFTGRDSASVLKAEDEYRKKHPNVQIMGYVLNSLIDEKTVDEEGAKEMFAFLDERDIHIDALVLNAADQGLNIKILENPLTDFMKVMNTNVAWNYLLSELAAKRMIKKGNGSILFVNSNTAYRAIPDRIAYIASKGGQLGMMRAMALDLGKYNIRVNAVLPGMIVTDRWEKNPSFYENVPSRFSPLGCVSKGDDIANAVWYLTACSKTATGAELVVDCGNTIQLYPNIPQTLK